jgi:hypothetical protein
MLFDSSAVGDFVSDRDYRYANLSMSSENFRLRTEISASAFEPNKMGDAKIHLAAI